MTITVARRIYDFLAHQNIKNVFMYSGGAIMPLVDQFAKPNNNHNIKYFISANEGCASASAVGYAKSSGNIGVVITTSGPGLTNAVTSILDAHADSTPLMVISGQVGKKAIGTNAFQEAPSVEITKPITKFSYLLKSPHEVDDVLDYAYNIAMDGKKGAVHIDIPKCVLTSSYPELEQTTNFRNRYRKSKWSEIHSLKIDTHKYIYAVEAINEAERPVIVVGKGCNDERSYHRLHKFALTGNIPVTSTLHGLGGFDENDSLSLKMLGMHGSYTANMAMQNADVIIALGSRFDDRTTGRVDAFAPKAKHIIHVNVEPSDVGKVVKSNHNFIIECHKALNIFNSFIEYRSRIEWFDLLSEWKKTHPLKYTPIRGKLLAQEVLTELDKAIKRSDYSRNKYFYTTGVGNHQMYTAQFLTHCSPRKMITSGSLGVMGSAIPYAIGAQIAHPESTIIAIDGDGSFNMSLNDLLTIKRYDLPIKIIVMNNSSQDMVRVWEELYMGGRYTATEMINPKFCQIAEAYGMKSMIINSTDVLKNTLDEFLNYDKAILLHCIVAKDMCLPLVGPGKALDDMVLSLNYDKKIDFTGAPPS